MIKLPFFTKQTHQNKYLGVELQSNSIRVVVFYIDENQKINIIGAAETTPEAGAIRNGNVVNMEHTISALKQCIGLAIPETEANIDKAIIGISGNYSVSVMTSARVKKVDVEKLTSKEIREIEEKLNSEASIQAQNEYTYITGDADTSLEELASSYFNIRGDNKSFNNIEIAEGKEIDVGMTSSYSPSFYLKNIQKTCRSCNLEISAAAPTLYAMANNIKTSGETDFVIIDASGDYTSIGVIFGGGVLANKTVNVGRIHFIEGISEKMGITIREAEKLLEGYKENKLAPSEQTVVAAGLREVAYLWISGIKLAISEFTGVKTFPQKIYVTGETSEIEDALTIFKETDWQKEFPFKESPVIDKIDLYNMDYITDLTGKAKTAKWFSCASLGLICKELTD